ncbi:hypothetical protein SALWKB12_1637 [Snodgrassella communis]|jgi:hypothetical protein|nr:hypothetical protein SALWKB12_1637 [Snodgrassella communis]
MIIAFCRAGFTDYCQNCAYKLQFVTQAFRLKKAKNTEA